MGEQTAIAWCDHTFNPWVGCTKVSPGCTHCYAETYDKRVGGVPVGQRRDGRVQLRWGKGAPRTHTSKSNWYQPVKWNTAAGLAGVRRRVFCSSLADAFDPEVPIAWLEELQGLIAITPHLDWLLLTKRPERFGRWVGPFDDNVWLGVTAENQEQANRRIPLLLAQDAGVRFLSCEPLLGPLDLDWPKGLYPDGPPTCCNGFECGCRGMPIDPPLWFGLDWIIIGGESGTEARPFELAWARDLVAGARAHGTAPFVKQLGANPVLSAGVCAARPTDKARSDPAGWPADLRVREFPSSRRRGPLLRPPQ